jgi:YesN/AraC family two-component response regulator
MKFNTYIPCEILKPFVKSFCIHEVIEQNTYKVLPATSLVLGFQYKGKLSRLQNGTEFSLSISGVSGLADHSIAFKNTHDTGTVLIYFQEAGARQFFRQPVHELFRESVSLDNFMLRSELLCVEEQLAEAKTDAQRIASIEQFLASQMTNAQPDMVVLEALKLIHRSKGNIRIKELTEQLCISQSSLEKKFRQAVGASPKKFASIVRLKNVLQHYDTTKSLTELGYQAGFYDQAHFIKEFKTFTGDTPEKFFSDKK